MEDTLKLILDELKGLKDGQRKLEDGQENLVGRLHNLEDGQKLLKEGQLELKKDVSSIKDYLINGLGPYFDHLEKHIDEKSDELKETLEGQQRVIDTLACSFR
ncbi:hypothetical protein [Bacillus suaedaesalsae]|uniref:DUF5082 domain-containing protein n=1 Tax=Bacillus suaedaesalsae TaxID=2810349 RepID=A0ABS2DES2_9BACI|nr:hypothetical protein [Bacillus suaedaesalsae]MBM6616972.1 hypothetical protein [Bacillus suaedaesalsae]